MKITNFHVRKSKRAINWTRYNRMKRQIKKERAEHLIRNSEFYNLKKTSLFFSELELYLIILNYGINTKIQNKSLKGKEWQAFHLTSKYN